MKKALFFNVAKKVFFSATLAVIAIGCNEPEPKKEIILTEADIELDAAKKAAAEKVFVGLPSPLETAVVLKSAGAKYDISVLNPVTNKDKYVSLTSRALNLGVYGSDLSFTAIFDKSQEAMLYLTCTKKLADELGIINAFNVERIERIEANLSNRDSLVSLISESFWESDSYLRENERGSVSALIVLGGWIEGLYLATSIEQSLRINNTNGEMVKRIAEQKSTLDNLIVLVELYNIDAPGIVSGLYELKEIYESIEESEAQAGVILTSSSGTPTIGNLVSFSVTTEQIQKIASKVAEIRNQIIS
jgi:hypothetical protein